MLSSTTNTFGVRNDSEIFYRHFERFYNEVFFKTLEERGIKIVMNLGDICDRRKYINFKTQNFLRSFYIDKLESMGVRQVNIIGNHDVYFKNTNRINCMTELFSDKIGNNFEVYSDPTEIEIDGRLFMLIPWVNDENREATVALMKKTKAKIAVGHLELAGFQMHLGSPSPHGSLDAASFKKFEKVLSGHYHHKSDDGKIHYLGAPMEFTWSDYKDPRGFHILDTETLELEYIQNPYRIFHKIFYNDMDMNAVQKGKMLNDFKKVAAAYKDCYVKVMVQNKTDQVLFEQFLDVLYSAQAADIGISEDKSIQSEIMLADDVDLSEDTPTILKKHIDQMTLQDNDKDALKIYFDQLYKEALELQDEA